MRTLDITNKLRVLILLPLVIGCTTTKDGKDEHLKSLQNDFGFRFYNSFDMYTLKGSNAIDLPDKSYPFVAVKVDSSSINIHYFMSEESTTYTKYKKVKDYYISTTIFPEETKDNFYKEISIYHSDRELLYSYSIYDNFEKLERLTFKYKNGRKSDYVNMDDSYYHYNDTLNENYVSILFPTLKKE